MSSIFAGFGACPTGAAAAMIRCLHYRDQAWATHDFRTGVLGAGARTHADAEQMFAPAASGQMVVDAPAWLCQRIVDGPASATSVDELLDQLGEIRGDVHCVASLPDGSVVVYRGLICARPLFFLATTAALLVASRPCAITAVEPGDVDPNGLASFLVPQLGDPSGSPWRGVQRVPPGHALIWRDGTTTVRRVAHVTVVDVDGATQPELVGMFRERLQTALDRSTGETNALLLSGGIDSSALAAAYTTLTSPKHRGRDTVRAFGLTYCAPLDACDERRYAHDVAERTSLDFVPIAANDLLPLGCPYPIGDEPDPWSYTGRNWALLTHISRTLGRETDAPVTVIAGEGGDELLLGQVFSVADRIARGDSEARAEIATFPDPASTATIIDHLLTGAFNSRHARMSRAVADLPPWFTRAWVDQAGVLDRLADNYPELGPAGSITPRYSQALVAEAGASGRAQCGGWWTDMGLRTGVDITYPFYDPDLAALIWALPPELIRSGGYEKAILRRALDAELPSSVAHRRDKADALALLHAGLTAHAPALYALAASSPLVELHIVDPRRLTAAIDRYLNGHQPHLAPALWGLAATHQWLTTQLN